MEVENDIICLGRGTDCHVYLPDPRVPLLHSQIDFRADAPYIAAASFSFDLRVNGVVTPSARLQPGDEINVGPYDIVVVENPTGKDLALTVELIRPLGDEFAELTARSRTDLTTVGLGKRGWSWLLFVMTFILTLALPLFAAMIKPPDSREARPPGVSDKALPDMAEKMRRAVSEINWLSTADSLWISGNISGPHRHFAEDCGSCHQKPFVQVRDAACLGCHAGIEHHADPQAFKTATFEEVKCARCHKEHNGIEPIVLTDQAFCVSCHGALDQREPKTTLHNATNFGTDHPEFRPSVVVDAASATLSRITIGSNPRPTENSNLKFPHSKHLDKKGTKHPRKGTVNLTCADCHKPEPGGVGMLPIRMEEHCHDCHELKFEPTAKDRQLPHGQPREAVEQMREFYAKMALHGGLEDPRAPDSVRRRRRPGTGLSRDESAASLDWALTKAAEVATETIGKRACGTCHFVTPPSVDGDGIWDIAPVFLADRWMPKGKFDHAKHKQMACVDCHVAPRSETAHDVLLPGIKTCQGCHGGEEAADRVPSTCIACHEFHQRGLPAMKAVPRQTTGSVGTTGN